jgi:hypothetical protein
MSDGSLHTTAFEHAIQTILDPKFRDRRTSEAAQATSPAQLRTLQAALSQPEVAGLVKYPIPQLLRQGRGFIRFTFLEDPEFLTELASHDPDPGWLISELLHTFGLDVMFFYARAYKEAFFKNPDIAANCINASMLLNEMGRISLFDVSEQTEWMQQYLLAVTPRREIMIRNLNPGGIIADACGLGLHDEARRYALAYCDAIEEDPGLAVRINSQLSFEYRLRNIGEHQAARRFVATLVEQMRSGNIPADLNNTTTIGAVKELVAIDAISQSFHPAWR